MKLLSRLERTFGALAIENLTLYIIFFQSVMWLFMQARPDLLEKITLDRDLVLQGQYWRLLGFAICPPPTNVLFLIFGFMLFYTMGTALEHQWGTFRYNVYLFVGYVATVTAVMFFPGAQATNVYLLGSVLLAFAQLYPDFQILMFFIIPVKVRYIAMFAWFGYLVGFLEGDWAHRAQIVAAVLNYVLFFHAEIIAGIKLTKHKIKSKAKISSVPIGEPLHTCTECGANDILNRRMEFRYCPLCQGTLCYCIDHINAHAHR